MQTKTLGRTGLEVTQLGYGAMQLRGPKVWGGPAVSDERAERTLNALLDAGINFVDTAVDYGLSEERIGRYISGRRGEYYLATKCGCDPRDTGEKTETPHTWTRDNLMRNITGSLERLKTDHVDILQLHNPSVDEVRKGRLVDALKDIQSQGLTRFIGISSTVPHLPEFLEMDVFDTFQIPYSCCEPEHHDAITGVGEAGAGVIVRGGIARGGPDTSQKRKDVWAAAGLDDLLGDMDRQEFILRYTISHPFCHTTIVGTSSLTHLAANIAAVNKGPLDKDLYDDVTRRVCEAVS
jgi:aryl-alcohol dehydrogenase-like predicted oxidoreductase